MTLTDTRCARITPHCPGRERDPGRTGPDPRLLVAAVLRIARAGAPRRDLPAEFGKWISVVEHFRGWVKPDAFHRRVGALADDVDFGNSVIAASSVKLHHRHGPGAKAELRAGPSGARGGVTTKSMAVADALGNLIGFRLLPGQAHDLRGIAALIAGLCCGRILADRAFDAHRVRDAPREARIAAVIPAKSTRRLPAAFERDTCKWRHPIEPSSQSSRNTEISQCAAAGPTQASTHSSPSPPPSFGCSERHHALDAGP